jgi:hypothetical protein
MVQTVPSVRLLMFAFVIQVVVGCVFVAWIAWSDFWMSAMVVPETSK